MVTLRVRFLLQPYLSGTNLIWILETQAASTFLKNLLSFTQLFAKSIIFWYPKPVWNQTSSMIAPTAGDSISETMVRNQAKLDRTRKLWYLFLRDFWPPVPKLCFLKGDLVLGSATPIFEIFSIFPNFVRF